MFTYPAVTLWNPAGGYCVVWSAEEYHSKLADGWSEDLPIEPSQALLAEQISEQVEQAAPEEKRTPRRKVTS